jgi:4-amino-4-deoxy-L-arabinose transferase-like glycosyltransferase
MVLRILGFVAVWSLYFAISEYYSAIHNDMAEAYAWGQEFQLGYNQHPPFWAWICGAWFLIFPRANWAFAILAMLNAGLGLIGAWALNGRFVQGDRRVAATALLAWTPFYSFLAYKYNANSIFLSLWPWTLYFFVGALRGGGLKDTLGFGVMMGLALNSKYYALTLAATCLLAALAAPEGRRYFRSASPYLSAVTAALLWAPHLIWLATTGAPPLRYLARVSGRTLGEAALYAATAVLGAALQQILALGAVAATRGEAEPARDRRLLLILALAPVGFSVLAALILRTKISSNMLIGVFPLTPLAAMSYGRPDPARLRRWAMRGAVILSLGALAASPLVAIGKARYGRDSEDADLRRDAAQAATAFWRATTHAPLRFVAGSFRYDNAAAFYSPERPSVFVNFDYFGNRWASPEKIAAQGLLVICRKDDAACLSETDTFSTPQTRREETTLERVRFGRTRGPIAFVFTAIPPR